MRGSVQWRISAHLHIILHSTLYILHFACQLPARRSDIISHRPPLGDIQTAAQNYRFELINAISLTFPEE